MKKTKFNIIQVIAHYPPFIGGMELRVQELVAKLAARGHEITVLTSDQETTAHTETNKNVTIKYLKSKEVAHTPIISGIVRELKRISNGSIVHVHIAQALLPEIVAVVCRMRKIPFIAHVRLDVPPSGLFGKTVLPIYKLLFLRSALHAASHVIVLTEDYRTLMKEKYGIKHEKISVIPNATDYILPEKPRLFPKKTINLLSVGRLTSQKNIPLLLNGLRTFLNSNPSQNIHLTIVGDGEQREMLEQLSSDLKLNKYVNFTGSLTGKTLEDTYALSDVFVLTSTHESFGTVLIEGMAKALPIIGTNIHAVRNVIEKDKNALLVDQNPQALAKAIALLTSDQNLYEKFSHHSLHLAKRYNWNSIVDDTEKLYQKVSK